MKRLFSLIIVLTVILGCSHTDYKELIKEKKYNEAIEVLYKEYRAKNDITALKEILIIENEYLEDYKSGIDILNAYTESGGSIEMLQSISCLLYFNRGLQLYKKQVFDSAFHYAQKAIELKKDYAGAYMLAGKANVRMGNAEIAYQYIEKALLHDSLMIEGYIYKGNIDLFTGNYDKAEMSYRKALNVDADYYDGWMNLAMLKYQTKKIDEALKYFKEGIRIDSVRIDAYDYIINIYTDMGRTDSVFRYIDVYQRKTGIDLRVKK